MTQIGDRVQMHPATAEWMQGDRFGVVVEVGKTGKLHVKLDRSGRVRRFREHDVRPA